VLRALRPEESLELVHRLDRDTAGACSSRARRRHCAVCTRLAHGRFRERYLALVRGKWELGAKRIDVPLRTGYEVGGGAHGALRVLPANPR